MSDERLKLIQELIRLRGRVFDKDGENEDFALLTRVIDQLKTEATEGEHGEKGRPYAHQV